MYKVMALCVTLFLCIHMLHDLLLILQTVTHFALSKMH